MEEDADADLMVSQPYLVPTLYRVVRLALPISWCIVMCVGLGSIFVILAPVGGQEEKKEEEDNS